MNNSQEILLKPFVKWVGGKRNVIKKYLYAYLPKKFKHYYEPFVGGGAMLFYLRPKDAYINDINGDLINTYIQIKNNHQELLKKLDDLKLSHSKKQFYVLRKKEANNDLDSAARFIYLNKTCFNGMYRVNSKGEFNVPFNNKKKDELFLYEKSNLENIAKYFNKNKISISNNDYLQFLKKPKKGDFVFVDSPYDYESNKNGFVSYDKKGFNQNDQISLANKLKELDKNGVQFMATNHKTKLILELYKDFNIYEISTNRSINSDGKNRKNAATEVVITNY